jgi:hypothetical protein
MRMNLNQPECNMLNEVKLKYGLMIRQDRIINNCRDSYERKAQPVTHSFEDRILFLSNNKEKLIQKAEELPLQWYYQNKRHYEIIEFIGA